MESLQPCLKWAQVWLGLLADFHYHLWKTGFVGPQCYRVMMSCMKAKRKAWAAWKNYAMGLQPLMGRCLVEIHRWDPNLWPLQCGQSPPQRSATWILDVKFPELNAEVSLGFCFIPFLPFLCLHVLKWKCMSLSLFLHCISGADDLFLPIIDTVGGVCL